MIVKLKMCIASKDFGKICLKALRDTFFPISGLCSKERLGETNENGRTQFCLVGGDI